MPPTYAIEYPATKKELVLLLRSRPWVVDLRRTDTQTRYRATDLPFKSKTVVFFAKRTLIPFVLERTESTFKIRRTLNGH